MYDFGENIFMNNEKYLDELDGRLQVLNELRKRIIELSKAIIGDLSLIHICIFKVQTLNLTQLLIVYGLAAVNIPIIQILKAIRLALKKKEK